MFVGVHVQRGSEGPSSVRKHVSCAFGSLFTPLSPDQVCEGLRRLTGSPVTELNLLTAELTEDHDALAQGPGDGAAGAGGPSVMSEVDVVDKLWAQLLSFHSAGFLLGASCNAREGVFLDFEEVGLMPNHAYSVLEVLQVEHNRLVRLHNPWGRYVASQGSKDGYGGRWMCVCVHEYA